MRPLNTRKPSITIVLGCSTGWMAGIREKATVCPTMAIVISTEVYSVEKPLSDIYTAR